MNIRVSPKAVCRQLLANLDKHQPLSPREEAQILSALDSCQNIPDLANRLLAQLSRNTLSMIIDKI